MSDDLFASLPPTEPDRWLSGLAPFEDATGRHLRMTIDCRLAATSWRPRVRRALTALGLRRAAERIPLRGRMEIELFAVQPVLGDLVDRSGVPAAERFLPTPPRVLQLALDSTPAQGVVYHLLTLRTDKGAAEFPAFEAIVRWRLLPD